MTQLRRTALTIATLVTAGFALSGPVGGAQAADTSWKTLVTISGAKIQACKVPETSTGPWTIKLRVDATKASGRVSGAAYITKNGEATDKMWKSGWVSAGHMSALGKVKLPANEKYAMDAGIGTSGMGDGGTFAASDLPRC
jgi:hypothetical protein